MAKAKAKASETLDDAIETLDDAMFSADMFVLDYVCKKHYIDCIHDICEHILAAYNRLKAFEIPTWEDLDYAKFPLFVKVATDDALMLGEKKRVNELMSKRGYTNITVVIERK